LSARRVRRFAVFVKNRLKSFYHSGKTHEGESKYSGGDQCNRGTFEAVGDVGEDEVFADAGHDANRKCESHTGTETENDGFGEIVDSPEVDEQAQAEDGAVGGDQGQENSEAAVEGREEFSQVHLNELDGTGDH